MNKISLQDVNYWSSLQQICIRQRRRGIKIDLDVIRKNIPILEKEINDLLQKILSFCNTDCTQDDINSPTKLAKILISLGYELPKTDKGNDQTSSKWMEQQDDELLNLIVEYRTLKLLLRDFFIKPLEMQQYTCPESLPDGKYGRVYPDYIPFGAITGRMSSNSPNIQQIPKRNKKWGKICRSIFVPDSKTWYSLDWSNQEGRLQVHYGAKIKAKGVDYLVSAFKQNPNLDLHYTVAKLAGFLCKNICNPDKLCIDCKQGRNAAKIVNLGLSYGMGTKKLCKSLKLPLEQAEKVLEDYYQALPFLKELTEKAKNTLIKQGFITTIGGRKSRREVIYNSDGTKHDVSYKALNKLIQGSGADMMYKCLKIMYNAGIDVICIVHDEFCIEGTLEDALQAQKIMETCLPLNVPLVAEIKGGKSWGELEKIDINLMKEVVK